MGSEMCIRDRNGSAPCVARGHTMCYVTCCVPSICPLVLTTLGAHLASSSAMPAMCQVRYISALEVNLHVQFSGDMSRTNRAMNQNTINIQWSERHDVWRSASCNKIDLFTPCCQHALHVFHGYVQCVHNGVLCGSGSSPTEFISAFISVNITHHEQSCRRARSEPIVDCRLDKHTFAMAHAGRAIHTVLHAGYIVHCTLYTLHASRRGLTRAMQASPTCSSVCQDANCEMQ